MSLALVKRFDCEKIRLIPEGEIPYKGRKNPAVFSFSRTVLGKQHDAVVDIANEHEIVSYDLLVHLCDRLRIDDPRDLVTAALDDTLEE